MTAATGKRQELFVFKYALSAAAACVAETGQHSHTVVTHTFLRWAHNLQANIRMPSLDCSSHSLWDMHCHWGGWGRGTIFRKFNMHKGETSSIRRTFSSVKAPPGYRFRWDVRLQGLYTYYTHYIRMHATYVVSNYSHALNSSFIDFNILWSLLSMLTLKQCYFWIFNWNFRFF